MTTEARVREALAGVTDPEYALSIVDLGLVYGVEVLGDSARIAITFTSIGCPAIDLILGDAEAAVRAVPGIQDVRFDLVWSPPWTAARLSPRGRRVLAMYGVTN